MSVWNSTKKELHGFKEDLKHGSLCSKLFVIAVIYIMVIASFSYFSMPKERRELYSRFLDFSDSMWKKVDKIEILLEQQRENQVDLWEYMNIEYTPQAEIWNNPKATKIRIKPKVKK